MLRSPFVETLYTADALSRVKRVTPEFVLGSGAPYTETTYGVDASQKHSFTEVADELGKKTRTYTDAFGNVARTILGFGATEATTTLFATNVVGQRTQITDPRSLVTSYATNTRNLLTSSTSPDAGTRFSSYDRAGNLRFSQDANQAAAEQVAFTSYDFAGRPLISGQGGASYASLIPDNPPTALETSSANWLTVRVYDAKPSTAAFPWNIFSTQISSLSLANVSGRLAAVASKSSGSWQVTLYSYDADGQVQKRHTFTQANGGGAVLTAVNTTDSLSHDLRGALTQRRLTVGANSFNHWFDYDARGLLWKSSASTTGTKPASADATYTYRPSAQPASRQFLGGPLVPMTYTIREQLAKIGDPAGTTYPFSAGYTYHLNGTVAESDFYNAGTPATAKRYRYVFGTGSYDALNRLKSADFSSHSGSSWTSTLVHDLAGITYDASGNLTALQRRRETGTLIDHLTYTTASTSNRLLSVSEAAGASAEAWDAEAGSFTYDANGNLLTAPAPYALTAVTYDSRNLPLTLTRGGVTTAYRYEASGQRITKQVGGGATEVYLLDGATSLGVVTLKTAGTPTAWHFNVLAGERVIGRAPHTGARRHYHTDLLGSTRAVVAGTTLLESTDYDPWGLALPGRSLGGGTKDGFTGKERDAESGLDAFGARQYLAAFGRWGSVDPLAELYPAWSPYNYVLNDPNRMTDPDGLCPRKAVEGSFCLDLFIQSLIKPFPLAGDGRSFDHDAPLEKSRAQIIVDPERRTVDPRVSVTCFAGRIGCSKEPRSDNKVELISRGDNEFVLRFELLNSRIPGPDIDGEVVFTRAAHGWRTSGDISAFPSNALYARRRGRWVTVKPHHTETWPTDLRDQRGRNKW